MTRSFFEDMVYPSGPLLAGIFRRIEDPRRIMRIVVVPYAERLGVLFTWLDPRIDLREKCTARVHLKPVARGGHIPYVGVDTMGGKDVVLVQADPRIVREGTRAIPLAGTREGHAPVFHTIVREVSRWLRQVSVHDVYSFAPEIMQGAGLATWSAVDEGPLTSFPTVAGRTAQHVRVWPGEGVLVVDGSDTLRCVPNDVLLGAVGGVAAADVVEVYRTEGPRIVFPTAVHPSSGGKEITLFFSSRETACVPLSSVRELQQRRAEVVAVGA